VAVALCESVSAAVCGSVWQCTLQRVAVRLVVCGNAVVRVWQCGSLRQSAAVGGSAQCAAVCAAVCGSVWQCVRQCEKNNSLINDWDTQFS
jgi:hypothetical protein